MNNPRRCKYTPINTPQYEHLVGVVGYAESVGKRYSWERNRYEFRPVHDTKGGKNSYTYTFNEADLTFLE